MINFQKQLENKLNEYRGKQIYLYGAKNMGGIAAKILSFYGIDINGYIVTQKSDIHTLNDYPIYEISNLPEEVFSENTEVILTLNDVFHNEVKKLLYQNNLYNIDDSFSKSQIYFFCEIYREIFEAHNIDLSSEIIKYGKFIFLNPYMEENLSPFWLECGDLLMPSILNDFRFICEGPYELDDVKPEADDVIIDCGANIGLFSAYAASCGSTVYAFEPCIEQLGNNLRDISALYNQKIIHVPFALSDNIGKASFCISEKTLGSNTLADISHKNHEKYVEKIIDVDVTTIDNFVQQNNIKKVDFIKADIEGAERNMLMGAKNVLREFAPKLAICTYHLPDDPQVLEHIILDANPNYKIVHKWKKLYAHI